MCTLERALYEALADSAELHRALWELQRVGLHVRLSIDCEREDKLMQADESLPRHPVASRQPPPAFRIDSNDLRFLHSIGIDPTRSRRSRRKS